MVEFVQSLSNIGVLMTADLRRPKMITNCLGAWAFSTALLFLTYFTFAHESTSRYPQERKRSTKAEMAKIGCDDYNDSLSIVNRIGRIGYVTALTLNDMRQELKAIAFLFVAKPVTLSATPEVDSR